MAEARAQVQGRESDYKSAFRPVRVQKEAFPEAAWNHGKLIGLPQAKLFDIAKEKCPSVSVYGLKGSETVETLAPDVPLDLQVPAENYAALVEALKNDGDTDLDFLIDVTAVDWVDHFDVIAQLMSTEKDTRCSSAFRFRNPRTSLKKNATSVLASLHHRHLPRRGMEGTRSVRYVRHKLHGPPRYAPHFPARISRAFRSARISHTHIIRKAV